MKKLLALFLAIFLILGLFAGCGQEEDDDRDDRRRRSSREEKVSDEEQENAEGVTEEDGWPIYTNPDDAIFPGTAQTAPAITERPTTEQSTTEQVPKDAEDNPLQPSDAKISPDQAQEIAREALGITKEQMLSPFVHIGTYGENNESCYSVQFATLDYDYEFVISAVTGEIYYRSDKP